MPDKKIIINNLTISYTDEGSSGASPIILIHGFPFNKEMWYRQVDILKADFRVIAYDVRGHGQSDRGNIDFSIDVFVEDLIHLMDALEIEKALVCGLSMGGYIALRARELHNERFLALILCDTQCIADTAEGKEKRMKAIDSIKIHGVAMYARASIINLFAEASFQNNEKEIAKVHRVIEQTSIETICRTLVALAHRRETCRRLEEIKIPTLILVGREDKITPIASARFMNEKIKNSTMTIIDEAGHMPNLENPGIFNVVIKEFALSLQKL